MEKELIKIAELLDCDFGAAFNMKDTGKVDVAHYHAGLKNIIERSDKNGTIGLGKRYRFTF